VCLVGIEGTGSYGAGLARHIAAAGIPVVEVDRSAGKTGAGRASPTRWMRSAPPGPPSPAGRLASRKDGTARWRRSGRSWSPGSARPPSTPWVSLLALNGLRVSEATGADIEQLGLERGHRTLVITRKGSKVVTIPLAPGTARAIDLAVGERTEGPLFVTADGRRLDRHGAARIVRRVTRRAGITKDVSPHTLRHAFITAALDAGVPLRDVQEAASHAGPRTTMRYDRARTSLDRHATYIVAAFIAGAAR
jgi:integrase